MQRQSEALMPTDWGTFRMITYAQSTREQMPHVAMVHPEMDPTQAVHLRIHSECMTGDLFHSNRCDCGEQLDAAMSIAAAEKGMVIYLRQEGRGIGHDTDQSVLDMVAHSSLKTPTAVATFLIERLLHFEQSLSVIAQAIRQTQLGHLHEKRQQLLQKEQQLQFIKRQQIQKQYWQLEQYERRLPQLLQQNLKSAQTQLKQLAEKHEILRLETSLNRGFSLVSKAGKIVSSKNDIAAKDQLDIDFKDGRQSITSKKT